ncbi:MAG: tRNA uridine-5-carboxymethylaminomethyl(34) synthesis GTPase MnmE [Acidobacteria bacterium RIFCSPLOWO2_02_FULL_65_29]|nr:MAG: tRNA uridine-5-carboxymethylaminomethyl(34) synthesis GTPase MnmE [Acidobacteria bacterium RIFCSPLOWO2_02_FULL_65_29]
MFSTADTIVAIATPPGRGGLGIVRLSGSAAHQIACALVARRAPLEPRRATLAKVRRTVTDAIDQVVLTYFRAPASYTGEEVVEVSAHGSPVVLKHIVIAAIGAGARLAEPGEFTLRAFLNGRIDLTQAEAVGDLIDAVTPLQARAAFDQLEGTLTRAIAEIDAALFDLVARLEASVDFPEEGYHFVAPATLAQAIDEIISRTRALLAGAARGRLVREGLQIAIVGRPNVGKSSLFNALAGAARAIVTDVPGTTRDLVTETIDLEGLRVTLVDTAGLRDTAEIVEAEGVRRSVGAAEVADLVLLVVDGTQAPDQSDHDVVNQLFDNKVLIVSNKADLEGVGAAPAHVGAVPVSALTGLGLDALRARIQEALQLFDGHPLRDRPEITNVRHAALVERAQAALIRARDAALADGGSMPEEFVLADLQDARAALEEVTGKRAPDDLLAHIFARFCVGK